MKTAVIYARYSSDNQTEQSIEGQLRVCNDYAQRNDIYIVDTYIDRAKTGKNDNRASFQKLLRDSIKQSWDYVIVYKLDRFSRNKYEIAIHKKTLKDNGIKLLSAMENIPDTPEGIILESLLEGMAEYYSAELSQKVTRGMNESRLKGQYTGGAVLFGYKVDNNKKIVIDEAESTLLLEIYEMYASGMFVKDIIADLTNRGIYHKNGKPFTRATMYKMLKNEKYLGKAVFNGETFDNIYPAIIPENLFNLVRAKTANNHYGKHGSPVSYLLKRKVFCGYCGNQISSETGTSPKGIINRYYKCYGRKLNIVDCKKSTIRKEVLENLVVETTFKLFDNNDSILPLADKILSIHKSRTNDSSAISILQSERDDISKSINNLISCIEKGIITTSTKDRLERLEADLEEIDKKLAQEKAKEKIPLTRDSIIKYLRTSLKKQPHLMIDLLINKIILYDDKIEIYYNYTDPTKRPDGRNCHQAFSIHNEIFETVLDDKHPTTSRVLLIVDALI